MKVNQLPERTTGEFLWCHKCGAEYSATRGDYFMLHPDHTLRCYTGGHRPINLRLVRRESRIVEVEPSV